MPDRLSVLITDAEDRCTIAACESLSTAGYRVGTASGTRFAPGQWSRFSDASYRTPDPRASMARFAGALASIAHRGGFATIVPGCDASLIAISSHRELFADTVNLGLPSKGVMDACISKTNLQEKAVEAGLSSPQTFACADEAETLRVAARLGYPVVLKPPSTVSISGRDGQVNQQKSVMAQDEGTLKACLAQFSFPCLLQRRKHGQVLSVAGVIADGRLLATAVSRYKRTWLPDAGSVSFSRTVTVSDRLIERVEELVASLGWMGLFELELIELPSGDFSAIDFNPRLYGSLALAVEAGASLPAVWCDWLLKGEATPQTARPGVNYRWDDADWRHAWNHLRGGRWAKAADVARPHRHTVHPYFRGRDPMPALARCLQMLRNNYSRARQ